MAKTSKGGTSAEDKTASDQAEVTEVSAAENDPVIEAEAVDDTAPEPAAESDDDRADLDDAPVELNDDADAPLDDAPAQDDALTTEPTPLAPVEQTVVRKGGTGSMLLGGVLAAGLGYGVNEYTRPGVDLDPTEAKITAQAEQIAQLQERLIALSEGPDLSGIEQAVANGSDQIAALASKTAQTETALTGLAERVTSVELRGQNGDADATAIAAYARELNELRDQVTTAAQGTQERIAKLEADADAARTAVDDARSLAEARSALSQVETALAEGGGFADAIAPLSQLVDVPEALRSVADGGVVTLRALQSDLPGVARGALTAARDAGEDGDTSGGSFGSFLRNQLNVRSTTAQDGDSANAVLSRVEDAVKRGDLQTALTEADTLPASARGAMQGWLDAAGARAGAVAATHAISQTLTQK